MGVGQGRGRQVSWREGSWAGIHGRVCGDKVERFELGQHGGQWVSG